MAKHIEKIILGHLEVIQELLKNESFQRNLDEQIDHCIRALKEGNKVLFCGNGGSAADAQHIASELSGKFYLDRDPLYAEALHVNSSYLTAVSNDYGFEHAYARLVEAKGKPGDVLFGLSTSGNSENVLRAFEQARRQGMVTIGWTGATGGKLINYSDMITLIPSEDTARIQEMHILLGHILCETVENSLFPG